MSEEIKPCPFCGSEASVETQFNQDFWIQCDNLDCASTDGKLFENDAEAIEAWNRRAAPAAAQLDAELPPLPPATEGTVTGARRWSASRMWEYADQARAPYAERIRLLEREKAERKTASIDTLIREVSAQLMGDVTERVGLPAEDGDDHGEQNYLTGKFAGISMFERKLLQLVDGRTAGTAVPEGYALAPLEPTEAMLKSAVRAFQSAYNSDDTLADWRAAYKASIAAAPSPQENTNEN